MIQKFKNLLITEFDNINESLTSVNESTVPALEWIEYLLEHQQGFERADDAKEFFDKLKSISGDIAILKLNVQNFKEKSLQIIDKKYLC